MSTSIAPPHLCAPALATVLVVEHDQGLHPLIARMLASVGFQARAVTTGADALAAVAKHGDSLRAVYLDLSLPDLQGEEVLARLRALHPTLPVVLTGLRFPRGSVASAVPFLMKPFRAQDLRDAIDRAVRAWAPSAAANDTSPVETFTLTLQCSRADLRAFDQAAESLRASLRETHPTVAAELTREAVVLLLARAEARRQALTPRRSGPVEMLSRTRA